ncbi:hypothetical protein N431DRAFT_463285 [Stipitochalara longipes BDJ]|nr:hypothetical protein N431DRAFT_463285 [Stipitochalara longipes BDJ]
MSKYVDHITTTPKHAKAKGGHWALDRAELDPLVMLEAMGKSATNRGNIRQNNSPLQMLHVLKDCLKSEEAIIRFDLLSMNERCVKLLRDVQEVCVTQSPLDFLLEEYGGDSNLISCFNHMLGGAVGNALGVDLKRHQASRFQEACLLVKKLVEGEGSIEYDLVKSRCFINGDGKKVIDSFETSVEDSILFRNRIA